MNQNFNNIKGFISHIKAKNTQTTEYKRKPYSKCQLYYVNGILFYLKVTKSIIKQFK